MDRSVDKDVFRISQHVLSDPESEPSMNKIDYIYFIQLWTMGMYRTCCAINSF